jgi:hypothetical protein
MKFAAQVVCGIALAVGCAAASAQSNAPGSDARGSDAGLHGLLHAAMPQDVAGPPKYVGPGSCSAVACHGGIQPNGGRVLQNEYSTWVTSDKHAQAYASLKTPLGRNIAAVLKIGPADKAQRCLVCHAVDAPESARARDFDISEGVSCESCHGPASQWLGPHIRATSTQDAWLKQHQEMVKLGLVDNQNLAVRSRQCLDCHLGAPGMKVDHELIAAGHPDLTFELDSFTAVEPPHWVEKDQATGGPASPMFGAKAWAVGQAVQLQMSMQRVARYAKSGPWPEFSEMDCMTCHHALTGPLSWRQKEGFGGHRPGDPPYNLSRYVLFKQFANEVNPQLNAQLETSAHKVAGLVTSMSADRNAVEAAAEQTADLAGRMVTSVQDATYDRARTGRLLAAITSDADAISADGERTAEQATMTVDSLYIAEVKDGGKNPATREAIDGLFKLVNNPSAYNAPQFAAQMKKVRATLP